MPKMITIKHADLMEMAAYIIGKYENQPEDTIGIRTARQKKRYEVESRARDIYKDYFRKGGK